MRCGAAQNAVGAAELTRSCSELQSNGLIGILPESAGSLTRLKVLCAPVHCGRALRLSHTPQSSGKQQPGRLAPRQPCEPVAPHLAVRLRPSSSTRVSLSTPPPGRCATAAHVAPCPRLGGFSPRMARCRVAHDAAGCLSGRALPGSGGASASKAVGRAAGHRRPAPRKRPLHGEERAVSLRAGGVDGVAHAFPSE